jgi:hypothetical protein
MVCVVCMLYAGSGGLSANLCLVSYLVLGRYGRKLCLGESWTLKKPLAARGLEVYIWEAEAFRVWRLGYVVGCGSLLHKCAM